MFIFTKDEYQSAHCHKNQITIFTAAFWHENECFPALVVPSDLSRSKECILVFMMTLLKNLHPDDVTTVQVWSDELTSQLKGAEATWRE